MRLLFVSFFCLLTISLVAAPQVTLYYEYTAEGYSLFADNEESFPVVIELDFELQNLKVVPENYTKITVPPNSIKYKLVDLIAISVLKGYDFDYTYKAEQGSELSITEAPVAINTIDPKLQETQKMEPPKKPESKPITNTKIEIKKPDVRIAKSEVNKPEEKMAVTTAVKEVATTVPKPKKEKVSDPVAKVITPVVKEPAKIIEKPKVKAKTEIVKAPVKPITPIAIVDTPVAVKVPVVVNNKIDKVIVNTVDEPVVVKMEEVVKKPITVTKPISVVDTPVSTPDPIVVAKTEIPKKKIEEVQKEKKEGSQAIGLNSKVTVVPQKEDPPATPMKTRPEIKILSPTVDTPVTTRKTEVVKTPVVVRQPTILDKPIVIKQPDPVVVNTSKATFDTSGKFDAAFKYSLPFNKGQGFTISQGYQGSISHANSFALDFSMPDGTAIHAAREGIIEKVVQNNTQGCASENCDAYDNYILVHHADGSFAKYAHIQKGSSVVAEGVIVAAGQLIAYSGATGWTNGPALHFEVYRVKDNAEKTVKTNFLTGDGSDYGILMEQQRYVKGY